MLISKNLGTLAFTLSFSLEMCLSCKLLSCVEKHINRKEINVIQNRKYSNISRRHHLEYQLP